MSNYITDIDDENLDHWKNLLENKPPYYHSWEDAVWELVEQFYQSENAIDHEVIDRAMAYLCVTANIDLDNLEYGLQVEHVSKSCNQQTLVNTEVN